MKTFMLMLSSAVHIGRYAEILKKPLSAAFIGVLLLTVVLGTIQYAGTAVRLSGIIKKGEVLYQKDFPYFKYSADKGLVVDARMPVIVEHESVLYIIDTTDPADKVFNDKYSAEFEKYKQAFFVGNRKLVAKQNEMETRTYDLNMLNSMPPFDKDDIGKKFYYWKYLAAICFPFYLSYFYCAKLISILIISLIAIVINSSSKYRFSYSALFTASAFALAVPLFVDTILSLAGINIPAFFLIYYAIAAIYLILGLKKAHAALSVEIKPE
jgi:hypothetical protein